MPTYDYLCIKCGNKEEHIHGMNAEPEVICCKCGNIMEKQVGTGARLIFKGSGFYQTDYKNKNGG